MKCRKKKGYDCFYLTRDNVKEFLEWFGKYNTVHSYNNCDDYLEVCIGYIDNEEDVFEFGYDSWQVFNDGSFYEYINGIFNKMYEIVEDKEM